MLGTAGLLAGLVVLLGCGPGSDAPPSPGPTTTPPAAQQPAEPPALASSTTTLRGAPPTAPAALQTPEDARRLLERRGVDPDELSRQVGEHMRERFAPKTAGDPAPKR
jgi:pyruvate/2-oxoglutarate dehydrogenase complex dihydrolipoamide acyltransferase (E2) component